MSDRDTTNPFAPLGNKGWLDPMPRKDVIMPPPIGFVSREEYTSCIAELEAQIVYMAAAWGDDALQVEELTRQLAEARDAALEDAAGYLDQQHRQLMIAKGRNPDDYQSEKSILATAIRAMKGAKP